jgi:glycosyltransferase involved in cell wall biosynthesis
VSVSIVICCYNSACRLGKTLKHISNLQIGTIQVELIIVDNASTDGTAIVAHKIWEKLNKPFPLQLVLEKQEGVRFARETGLNTAQYEYVLFCDDDNWLMPNYLELAYNIMISNSTIGAIGGCSIPVSSEDLPIWFTTYQSNFAVGVQSLYSGDITERGYLWTAGMMLKRDLYIKLKECGFIFFLTGRKGNVLSAGEDSELCKWFILAGYKLWYDERLVFKHFISDNRLTKGYYARMNLGITESNSVLSSYNGLIEYTNKKSCFKRIGFFLIYIVAAILTQNITFLNKAEGFNPFPFNLFSKKCFRIKKWYRNYKLLYKN